MSPSLSFADRVGDELCKFAILVGIDICILLDIGDGIFMLFSLLIYRELFCIIPILSVFSDQILTICYKNNISVEIFLNFSLSSGKDINRFAMHIAKMANLSLSCQNLTKTFGQGEAAVPALRGINLEIERGEFFLPTGPSGCGKTTLISVIIVILNKKPMII